jgi:hypothetical protein
MGTAQNTMCLRRNEMKKGQGNGWQDGFEKP